MLNSAKNSSFPPKLVNLTTLAPQIKLFSNYNNSIYYIFWKIQKTLHKNFWPLLAHFLLFYTVQKNPAAL